MADNVEYCSMVKEDKDEIHLLLKKSFLRDEPIAKSLGMDIFETNDWLSKRVKDCGDMNMSTVEEATLKGRELGYRLFVADASSNYTTRLFEKLEYDVLVVKRYDEFKDKNGDAIFRDTGEHQEAKLIAKFYN